VVPKPTDKIEKTDEFAENGTLRNVPVHGRRRRSRRRSGVLRFSAGFGDFSQSKSLYLEMVINLDLK